MPNRRKKLAKRSGEEMPVPKNARQTNAKSHDSRSQEKHPENLGNPGPRSSDGPVNGNMDNCQGKNDSDGFPGRKKTEGFPCSRDSSGFNSNGKVNGISCTADVDDNGNSNGKVNGVSGITEVDDNGNGSGKVNGVNGSAEVDGISIAEVDGNGNAKVAIVDGTAKVDRFHWDKRSGHNGFSGSKIYISNGKSRVSGPYMNKAGGFRSNNKSGCFYNNTKTNRPQSNGKPDEPERNTKHDVLHGNGQTNDAPSKPVDLPICTVDFNTDGNPVFTKPNEKQTNAQAKYNAVVKKYSEEPLSFFQPDLGKSTVDDLKSPSVEELCAKWPCIEPKSDVEFSSDAENLPKKQYCKTSPVKQASHDKSSPVPNEVPSNDCYSPENDVLKKFDVLKLAPRFTKSHQKGPYSLQNPVGPNNDMNQLADDSSHAEYTSAGSWQSSNFHGLSRKSKQSGDSSNIAWNYGQHGYSAWNSSQYGSPRKSGPSVYNHRSNPDENYDGTGVEYNGGMNSRNQYYSNQGRGQGGPENSMGRGGQKRNKNGRKFNNQNGYQGDGKKHFGRPGQDRKSSMGPHGKTGPPLGYFSNHEAYVGQNLVSAMPPLIGSQGMQPQIVNQMGAVQPQMMGLVEAMQPQMVNSAGPQMLSPLQFGDDQQYTMAIFPNGYVANQWIDMGGYSESQQVLVQANGEVVPLTIANMMPYIVPYTSGLPNAGVPMLIPAIAPPLETGVNAQTTTNGQLFTNPTGNSPQMNSSAHFDPNHAITNNTQVYSANQNFNIHGTNPTPAQTISHSVSSHVGPISACSEAQNHFTQSQLEKSWECGTPTRAPMGNPGDDAPIHTQVNGDQMAQLNAATGSSSGHLAETSESTIRQNHANAPVPSPSQTPGTPLYGTPKSFIFDTSETPNGTPCGSLNGTPEVWNETPSTSTGTPGHQNVIPGTSPNTAHTDAKGQHNKVKMMSVKQVERMQRMSSANGKRVPMNARSKDSPNHMPPAPQEVQEELVKFVCDSWNKVNQEYQKGSPAVAFHDPDPCPLEGFVPFDLEAYWGKRLVQNMTNQNIPTQNM